MPSENDTRFIKMDPMFLPFQNMNCQVHLFMSYSASLTLCQQALTDHCSQRICIVRTTVNDLIHHLSLQEGRRRKSTCKRQKHLLKVKWG